MKRIVEGDVGKKASGSVFVGASYACQTVVETESLAWLADLGFSAVLVIP